MFVPKCGAHLKMRAYTRLNLLYDGGKYKELYKSIKSNDPLMFPGYKEKLVKLEETTNLDEAVVCATEVDEESCCLCDGFSFFNGEYVRCCRRKDY